VFESLLPVARERRPVVAGGRIPAGLSETAKAELAKLFFATGIMVASGDEVVPPALFFNGKYLSTLHLYLPYLFLILTYLISTNLMLSLFYLPYPTKVFRAVTSQRSCILGNHSCWRITNGRRAMASKEELKA